eukprot:scaffold1163_cov362-Prasinococcus_capsulatus_cf.AAC.8
MTKESVTTRADRADRATHPPLLVDQLTTLESAMATIAVGGRATARHMTERHDTLAPHIQEAAA